MSFGVRAALVVLMAAIVVVPMVPTDVARAEAIESDQIGLVDSATGEWHLRGPDGFTTSFFFGNPGDVPMVGDWDCDGVDTPGLYRQTDGYVYLRNSNTQGNADIRFFFGNPGDVPLAGDFNADGCDTVSIYRQTEGRVYIINRLGDNDGGLGAADYDFYFGNPGDTPFVGDFNADGTSTIGLHRASTGLVYFRNTNTQGNADVSFIFGDPQDRLIAGDWTHNGADSVAIYRPSDRTFYLRYTNTQGNADEAFDFGTSRMIPVSGTFGIPAKKVADRAWTVSTVAAPVEWGRFASLGFGADGRAVVSHGSKTEWGTYQLAFTQCRDQTCTVSHTRHEPWRISDHSSMATGSDWLPVWSFHDDAGGRLVGAHCDDAGCATISYSVVDPVEPIPSWPPANSGVLASVAIGADGNPVIVYLNTDQNSGLWLAHCHDGPCVTADRVSVDRHLSDFHRFDVAIGTDGLPIIARFGSDLGNLALSVMHCADPGCSTGTTTMIQRWEQNYDGWGFPSVSIGADGLPIVAYNDLDVRYGGTPDPIRNESLKVAHCDDVACETVTVSTIVKGRTDFVSMDIGGDGLPFIAYHTGGVLKVAHCDDIACISSTTIATVDPGPQVGSFASLAVDPLGMPMIAYYDGTGHDLKVARLDS